MARLATGVRKRPDGTFEKRFTLEGKRYSVYGKTTKELNAKEIELRKQIEAGLYKNNKTVTLDEYFDEWIERKKNILKESSCMNYKSQYKRISSVLGKRKVSKIERREVLELQKKIAEAYNNTTSNTAVTLLKNILNEAVVDEILFKNPANGIKKLKVEKKKASESYHRGLTEREQIEFMNEAKDNFYYELFALLLSTGMRYGEAAALTWNDIDYKANVIHITKTVTCDENGSLIIGATPKTEAGKRDVPMNKTIQDIIKSQKLKMQAFYGVNVLRFDKRIFSTVNGNIVNNRQINREIKGILTDLSNKGICIEHFTAHALRDTFATRFIEQGGQPQTLKTILGHSSLSLTMDLYSHVLPNTRQKEMDNIKIVI